MRSFFTVVLVVAAFENALADIISIERQRDFLMEYEPPKSPSDLLNTNLFKEIAEKLHEGDMLLTDSQKDDYSLTPDVGGSHEGVFSLWSSNKVTYKISKPGPSKELVVGAMKHWSEKTCAQFHESASGSLTIRSGEGCYATVGSGGSPELVTHDDCLTEPVLVHLLGHVLGLPHAHSRPDRDKYLMVRAHNGLTSDFKYLNSKALCKCQFNHQSIMMHDTYGLSRSGEAVFLAAHSSSSSITASSSFGFQEAELSETDVAWAKTMLKCGNAPPCSKPPPPPEPHPCNVDITTKDARFQQLALTFEVMERNRPNNCVWRVHYSGGEKCVRAGMLIIFETTNDLDRRLFLFSTGCRFFQVEVFDPLFKSSHFYCGSEFVRKAHKMFMTGGVHPKLGLSRQLWAYVRFRATTGPVAAQNKMGTGDLGKTAKMYAFTLEDKYCSDRISPVAPCF